MKYITDSSNNLSFNPDPPTIMHIDLNSCFATIEQQANPLLRGKPLVVAAYATSSGCIIAPSIEAKTLGIKVGMKVKDGKSIYPNLLVLSPDPSKYKNIHLKMKKILSEYTYDVTPKSIDEFVLNFDSHLLSALSFKEIAKKIKKRIKNEIGEVITVSIGVSTNRLLAKVAAGIKKPDGFIQINKDNFKDYYLALELMQIPWIKERNTIRLNQVKIFNVVDFYNASIPTLKTAFQSVLGYYWYFRLRGWEVDNVDFSRKSYGNSYALSMPLKSVKEILPIISKLVEKMSFRLRKTGYSAKGVNLAILYRDGDYFHKAISFNNAFFDTRDIYIKIFDIFISFFKNKAVKNIAVSVFNLQKREIIQYEIFDDISKKNNLCKAKDLINSKWGNFTITSGRMMGTSDIIKERISFGGIKEIEEFIFSD